MSRSRRIGFLIALALSSGVALAAQDEVPPAKHLPCFPGAYYRKAVSSQDLWSGIEGVVTLPTIQFDETRKRPEKPGQFLDNPSIYMGGRAKDREIDAGLTWSEIREPDGTVSKERKAFRPFWRNEKWYNAPAEPQFYYYPGDTVRMSCRVENAGKMILEVALLARAGEERKPRGEPISVFRTEFDARNFGPGEVQEFKRVNAIDLVRNEGKPAAPTRTEVRGAVWHECCLLRGPGDKRPMTPERYTDMRCPDRDLVTVTLRGEQGGEEIAIRGKGE